MWVHEICKVPECSIHLWLDCYCNMAVLFSGTVMINNQHTYIWATFFVRTGTWWGLCPEKGSHLTIMSSSQPDYTVETVMNFMNTLDIFTNLLVSFYNFYGFCPIACLTPIAINLVYEQPISSSSESQWKMPLYWSRNIWYQ